MRRGARSSSGSVRRCSRPALAIALAIWGCSGIAAGQDGGEGGGSAPRLVDPKLTSKVEIRSIGRGDGSDASSGDAYPGSGGSKPSAEFFGIRAEGRLFAFVIDRSGSMESGGRLSRAKSELRRTIDGMGFAQSFLVIAFNDEAFAMRGGRTTTADAEGRRALRSWLNLVTADGRTDPRAAMSQALGTRPDAVFLLTDGEFPRGIVEELIRMNGGRTPIHCVDLSGGAARAGLSRIAESSGGKYAAPR